MAQKQFSDNLKSRQSSSGLKRLQSNLLRIWTQKSTVSQFLAGYHSPKGTQLQFAKKPYGKGRIDAKMLLGQTTFELLDWNESSDRKSNKKNQIRKNIAFQRNNFILSLKYGAIKVWACSVGSGPEQLAISVKTIWIKRVNSPKKYQDVCLHAARQRPSVHMLFHQSQSSYWQIKKKLCNSEVLIITEIEKLWKDLK